MKSRKILKTSKGGSYYIEITSAMAESLEWSAGDSILLEVEEVWLYDRCKKTCTLSNLTKQNYDRLVDAINQLGPKNKARNREQ